MVVICSSLYSHFILTEICTSLVGCSNITNFPNGEIWYPPSSTSNEVHVQGTVIYFNCTAGYYLDSLPATDVTDCTNAGQWRNIPSCLSKHVIVARAETASII